MSEFADRVAIITGAARGQGRATAELLARRGARVVLTDVLDDLGYRAAGEIGPRAMFLHHDVSSEEQWQRCVATTVEAFGPVDILVNNAGVHHISFIENETAADYRAMLDVNSVGPFLGIRAVLPVMRGRGGSIINVSSTAGLEGVVGHSAYAASKWALRGLSRTAALELGGLGIRVNSIHPGTIDTPMHPVGAFPTDEVYQSAALERVGRAAEVAEVVAFLAGDSASYVTGAEIAVDGGMVAGPVVPGLAKYSRA